MVVTYAQKPDASTCSTETMAACNATAKSITSLYDLGPGDHIKTNGILYDHHMIVVKVISEDTVRIIHKRKDQEAVVEEEVSCRPEDLTLLVYDSPFSGTEIVRRARERIGQSYNRCLPTANTLSLRSGLGGQ